MRSPKKSRKGEDKGAKLDDLSVHKKNFYVASYPVVLIFNIIRTLLYHVFLLLKTLYRAGSYVYCTKTEVKERTSVELAETGAVVKEQECGEEYGIPGGSTDMPPKLPPGPGPGDPLLAKQKHHHRKAFEYISKALKIDEENEGKCDIRLCLSFFFCIRSKLPIYGLRDG